MPTYSLIPPPKWYIADRSGQPAAGAKLYIYDANDKSTPLSWYKDAGAINAWPNPVVFDDSNGTQGPFYAQDGQLYYIEVFGSDGTFLWSQDNLDAPAPSSASHTINYNDNSNYFNNSDFRFNYYPDTNKDLSTETDPVLLADGGWSFVKSDATSVDSAEFKSFTAGQTDVPFNPLYYLRYECTDIGIGADKWIYFRFPNVNSFASDSANVISLGAYIRSSTSTDVEVYYRQYFGTGGSADVTGSLGTFTTSSSWDQKELTNKTIPSVTGKTIGDGSFLEIQFRIDPSSICIVDFTQFQFEYDDTLTAYEYDSDQINRKSTIGGELPRIIPGNLTGQTDYNSPTYLSDGTMSGTYGGSLPVGAEIMWPTETAPDGFLLENASSYTVVGDDKTYTRLYAVIGQRYGIGSDGFFISDGASAELLFRTSTGGVITAPNAQTSGFTISTTLTGVAASPFTVYNYSGTTAQTWVEFRNQVVGALSDTTSTGTASGVTLSTLQTGTSELVHIAQFTFPAASTLSAGQYIYVSSTTTQYYYWFEIGGSGSDPAPGGTGVKVVLGASDTAEQVAQAVLNASRGLQIVSVTCVAASSLSGGEYFDISGPTITWRPWYRKDGSGTEPTGGAGIVVFPIDIATGDADTDVASKTKTAMSALQFQVDDCRGAFFRGFDNGTGLDPDASTRRIMQTQDPATYGGDHVGTIQYDENKSHKHTQNSNIATEGGGGGKKLEAPGNDTWNSNAIAYEGGYESRPYNKARWIAIKY